MVWIASNPPLDADDKKLLKFLRVRADQESARKTVLLFSLYKYLEAHKLKTPKEIEVPTKVEQPQVIKATKENPVVVTTLLTI